MANISFKVFEGSVPRMAPHLLDPSSAAEAIDCRFDHGTLQSWREPRHVADILPTTKTVYRYNCCTLEFEDCVDIAESTAACGKLYVSGGADYPRVLSFEGSENPCDYVERRLGIPCIYDAPSVAPGAMNGAAAKDTEFRSYAYQYVDSFGGRGALSLPSEVTQVRDGQTVIVSGFVLPSDPSWDVQKIRVYRTVSGYQTGGEDANVLDTTWMFVGEIAASTPALVDTQRNEDLSSALEEDEVMPPPAGLRGLTYIESMNALVGFVGNKIYFSAPNEYHNWTDYMTLDDNIMGITESNGDIYAATDGRPYVIRATGDCKTMACRASVRLDQALPAVGFGNRRILATTFGAVYVTHEGLVALQKNSAPKIITHSLYAPDDFAKLVPQSLVLASHDGYVFAFGGRKSFVMKLHGILNEGWRSDTHSQLSDTDVTDAFVTRQGDFYLVKGNALVEWNRGLTWRPHKWTSAEIVSSPPVPLAAGLVHLAHGAEQITILADSKSVLNRSILKSQEFPLPRWAKGQRWQVHLEGIATVKLVSLASTMRAF